MLGMLIRLSDVCAMELGARALPAGQNVGARLLFLRRRQRLGRRAAAGLAGLSPTTVAAIEGGADCQIAAAVRLAEALGAVLRLGPTGAASSFWGGAATSSAYHGWTTPPEVLEVLYVVVGGEFGLDPCSPVRRGPSAPVRARLRFTSEDDGLGRPWRATSVYMNPPYGRQLGLWMAKARMEAEAGRAGLVIALVPARTDTRWWHDHVAGKADVWLLRGRLSFGDGTMAAPFPSAIVAWGATDYARSMLGEALPGAWHVPRSRVLFQEPTDSTPSAA
jgi:DNA-binding XRE family transcriptional regulator